MKMLRPFGSSWINSQMSSTMTELSILVISVPFCPQISSQVVPLRFLLIIKEKYSTGVILFSAGTSVVISELDSSFTDESVEVRVGAGVEDLFLLSHVKATARRTTTAKRRVVRMVGQE